MLHIAVIHIDFAALFHAIVHLFDLSSTTGTASGG